MALRVVRTAHEALASPPVTGVVREALAAGGRAVLLVPTFPQALVVQRGLADEGITLGVTVTTPQAWVAERWAVWGSGERIVSAGAAAVVMGEALDEGGAAVLPGTVGLLCALARRALPWLPLRADGSLDRTRLPAGITSAEADAIAVVGTYRARLRAQGLVECAEVMDLMPALLRGCGTAVAPLVVAGFDVMGRAERELVVGMASIIDVTVVVGDAHGISGGVARTLVDGLLALAGGRGLPASVTDDARISSATSRRDAELADVISALTGRGTSSGVAAAGAVRLLEPAGPLAEAELVAREVVALGVAGAHDVVVTSPDMPRAWRELAPKLAARGVCVSAQLSVPLARTEVGRALLGYMQSVAHLRELDASWPEPAGDARRLGDMSWWPPRQVSDFLLSGVAHVERAKAVALDAAWRSNRLLSPGDVLAALLSAKATSAPVEQATRELLRGRLGSAASRLLAPSVPAASGASASPDPREALAALEAAAVLGSVLGVGSTLRELGISADPRPDGAASLARLVEAASRALAAEPITLRPTLEVDEPVCAVRMLSPAQAARLPPSSVDALVVCGLTSDEWTLSRGDLADELLLELGVEAATDDVARARSRFVDIIAVPRGTLVLERTRFTAASHERYPSALLTELLACYGASSPPVAGLGEGGAAAHVSACGVAPRKEAEEPRSGVGRVGSSLRDLVIVPSEGTPSLPGTAPLLSASQIESYLECPLKWFSLRRLRLHDSDAACGPAEMGTFVHRVLELTQRALLAEGLAKASDGDPRAAATMAALAGIHRADGHAAPSPRPPADELPPLLSLRLPGQRANGDEARLEHAEELLLGAFDEHLAHQYLLEGGHAHFQALVAHTARERSDVGRLRDDLRSLVRYEDARLAGFEPRLLEWDFGGRRGPVSYAGANIVGTVDRVDVDAHGQALVIDYKHKGVGGFVAEHAAFGGDGWMPGMPFALPRRVQALVYAQVIRRAFPGLRMVGALYLGTKGDHELAGAVSADQLDRVLGTSVTAAARRSSVPAEEAFDRASTDAVGMDALLDATEAAIARRIDELRAGNVEARPVDGRACRFCPVLGCERRLA